MWSVFLQFLFGNPNLKLGRNDVQSTQMGKKLKNNSYHGHGFLERGNKWIIKYLYWKHIDISLALVIQSYDTFHKAYANTITVFHILIQKMDKISQKAILAKKFLILFFLSNTSKTNSSFGRICLFFFHNCAGDKMTILSEIDGRQIYFNQYISYQ